MLVARIYAEEWEIDARLAKFGVTRDELITVVRATLADRSNAVDADPLNAPGTLAYFSGTRHLRWLFLAKDAKWKIDRERNIESVLDHTTGLKIAYQNVDIAASDKHPKAISGKKAGTAKAITNAQGSLFPPGELPNAIDQASVARLNSSIWYLCVSFDGDEVRAELSLPASVQNGNFYGFIERIFLVKGGKWADFSIRDGSDDTPIEFEPKIVRR